MFRGKSAKKSSCLHLLFYDHKFKQFHIQIHHDEQCTCNKYTYKGKHQTYKKHTRVLSDKNLLLESNI